MKTCINLNDNWQFRMEEDSNWLPAIVPGCVHTDLLANAKIPDPFYRDNEKSLQWIDKKNWIYRCEFQMDSAQLTNKQIRMVFEGLDTYAKVILNGSEILKTNNMFRSWEVDVKQQLTKGKNQLEIVFTSPITIGLQQLEKLGYALPAVNDQSENGEMADKKVSVFCRKAPYHFGWDWGPRFVTSGIWRPINIIFSNEAEISNVYYEQIEVTDNKAELSVKVEINCTVKDNYEITIDAGDGKTLISLTKILTVGKNSIEIPIQIDNPKLWWPNGMGIPHQYNFTVQLQRNKTIIDRDNTKIGLRSVKLVLKEDETGKSFYFQINGHPIFIKGANYIPNDNFLNRVDSVKYENILQSAVDANMNMLRVWGGGIYENDLFYELCDKKGILVWQDFMFACSMYPSDPDFLENVRLEVEENIIRLRNYSCIALWCGNNEMDVAWSQNDPVGGWGWKEKYTPAQQATIWQGYDTLFHFIIPDAVKKYDHQRSYWPSSPLADWGEHSNNSSTSGDIHYWGVWHGSEPFTNFYKYTGRFMSEYGFQSFPEKNSVKKFTMPHDWDISSSVMLAHQRSGLGNQRIIEYMDDLYKVPSNFDDILYLGQVLQAEGIKQAINAHRSKKPYCMGTLFWQLNDCWPAASWSGIDYYGTWKALHYYTKRAYAPVTLSFVSANENILEMFVNNDRDKPVNATVHYYLRTFNGHILDEKEMNISASHLQSTKTFTLAIPELKEKYNLSELYLDAVISESGTELFRDQYFFVTPKKLQLNNAKIDVTLIYNANSTKIELTAKELMVDVFVSLLNIDSRFSDNYFNILPGETKTIQLIQPATKIDFNSVKLMYINKL